MMSAHNSFIKMENIITLNNETPFQVNNLVIDEEFNIQLDYDNDRTIELELGLFKRVDNNTICFTAYYDMTENLKKDSLESKIDYAASLVKFIEALKPTILKYADPVSLKSIYFNSIHDLNFSLVIRAESLQEVVEMISCFYNDWCQEAKKQFDLFIKEFNVY